MDEVPIELGNKEPLKVGNKVFKSAYDWDLTEKDFEKAALEIGETKEKRKICLRELKEKLSNDSKIIYRLDDSYLLRFLRFRKYNVKRAYQNVKQFMECRRKNINLVVMPPDLKFVQQMNIVTMLPYTDEERSVILLMNFDNWNPEETTVDDGLRSIVNVLDIASMNPNCQINGVIGIFNFSGVTLGHISEILRSGRLWTCISAIQNAYPWRIKQCFIYNTNQLVRILYNIVKPILSRKIAERVVLLGSDINELHQHVNKVLLPKRLKGSVEDSECDTSQLVMNNLAYLKYEKSFGFEERNFSI